MAAVFDRSSVLPPNALGGTEGGLSPSIEVSFHAMLLRECGVKCIGHTHPTAINQNHVHGARGGLCASATLSRRGRALWSSGRLLVPYGDPGLPLALIMRHHLHQFVEQNEEPPKLILLTKPRHDCLRRYSQDEILTITAMAVKSAKIFSGALQLGKAIHLPDEEVQHLYKRPDEIYRRQLFVEDSKTH